MKKNRVVHHLTADDSEVGSHRGSWLLKEAENLELKKAIPRWRSVEPFCKNLSRSPQETFREANKTVKTSQFP